MTSLSRIIRSTAEESNIREIKIRNFSFTEELETDEIERNMSVTSILDEQNRIRQSFEEEVASTRAQMAQEQQALQESLAQQRQDWELEKQQLQQQAYEEGFQKGYVDGEIKIREDLQQKVNEANELVHAAVENGNVYLQEQERIILDLAIESANRIIGRKIEENPDVFLDIVKRALIEVRESEFIKVFTSSTYYSYVTSKRDELETLLPPNLLFTVFVDDQLDETACYIESNHGRMIVTLDEQLNELKKILLAILESED